MQATDVSQPIEYAVGLASCRFDQIFSCKRSMSKSVRTLWINKEISSKTIVFEFLWTDTEEVFLVHLAVLEPVSLILDRAHSDLNVLPPSLAFSDFIFLRMNP